MKRPDRDTIRRVLDERATPQEAREVARWFSSAEAMFLSYWFSRARLAERTPSSYRSTWMRLLA